MVKNIHISEEEISRLVREELTPEDLKKQVAQK